MRKFRWLLILIVGWSLAPLPRGNAQEEEETPAVKASTATQRPKKKLRRPMMFRRHYGVGFGLFSFYPPQPTLHLSYRLNSQFNAGTEFGYWAYNSSQFSGSGSYFGLEAKYHIFARTFFVGLGLGRRTITVETTNDFAVDVQSYDVTWTREVVQTTISPRVGWMSLPTSGTAILFSVGVLYPLSTKFSMTHDPDPIPGLPAAEEEKEEKEKKEDVTRVTNRVLPQLELKYFWYFDL